jgi:hypothetical protein
MSHGRGAARYLPPQHGAWAFLAVPLLLGWSTASWSWVQVPFAAAWVAAYPTSYFALQALRGGRRRAAAVRPLQVWGVVTSALGIAALVGRPWLVWAGALWALSFGVNAVFARRGDERSIANDIVLVFQSASVLPVVSLLGLDAYTALTPPAIDLVPRDAWLLTAACVLWFGGSVLHVKSLIRERRDPRWMWASRLYHVAVLPVAWLLSPWLTVPFAFALVRAWAVTPDRALRPAAIGAIETVGAVLLVVFGWLV